jgi:D-alanyl-D-alanine carboxypeptidase
MGCIVTRRSVLRARAKLCVLPVLAAFLTFSFGPAPAAAQEKYAAIVVDANTGKTLFARHADAKRYPASLTKMMTLYVLFEELEAGRLNLNSRLSVSKYAAAQAPSKIGVQAGGTLKVEDAILALVTKSANDVAVVVAESIGGSVSSFAERMTRTARRLGMRSTVFRNPHGLPNNGQTTTARDLVILASALQDRFPSYYKYFGTRSFAYKGKRHRNHNRLLGSVEGVDGIKTGYIRASGFNLVTNVKRDGRHIIAVVMGGKTGASRDAHMRELISDYLPKAKRGARSAPLLIVDSGEIGLVAEARLPRPRPTTAASSPALVAYAAPSEPRDIVAAAMAEAPVAPTKAAVSPNVPAEATDDPVAERISAASEIAESVQAAVPAEEEDDTIARLQELARMEARESDLVAAGVQAEPQAEDALEPGWYVQIGAVPTEEGAQALLEKARASLGAELGSFKPVTQPIEHNGEKLYRARFAGFPGKEKARAVCDKLKTKSFACLAVQS